MTAIDSKVNAALGHEAHLLAQIASGDHLDVRQYTVRQRMSALFEVSLVALSENASVDLDAVVGQEASFTIPTAPPAEPRFWKGICNHMQLVAAEPGGLSTYHVSIVPTLWLATQRRNYRMFQQISEPDIVQKMLSEWGIDPDLRIDPAAYKKRKYRVQYGESDFDFMSRMLEDAGISFFFEQQDQESRLVLCDAPENGTRRPSALRFNASPTGEAARGEHVTAVRYGQQVRPGKLTMRDHDYRLSPTYKLLASAARGLPAEARLESFHYAPGAFLFGSDKGESTPAADDRGKTRTDEAEGSLLAQKRLDAQRGSAKVCTFETNVLDLAPGVVMSIDDHPHMAFAGGKGLLMVDASLAGTSHGEGSCHCEARSAEVPYRPPLVTPRPKVSGVESATVVGPPGEEIHTDEFARVRVHFHWDRESRMDDKSSCWIHVSQPWGGAGYGGTNLPRVGQEVLVDFIGGDPDKPVIVGRVYTNLQKTPYKLPANKTQSGWKSNSTGGSGGYNEIMFEDAGGKELVRIQAERDLQKLVKNDEDVTIENDRTKFVKNDDSLTVGNDRTMLVQMNERDVVGLSHTRAVGVNENVAIGFNQSVKVGGWQNVAVGLTSTETVGLGKTLTVGATYQISVDVLTIAATTRLELMCGGAKITLDKSGRITLEGDPIIQKGPAQARKNAAASVAVACNNVAAACGILAALTSETGVGTVGFGIACGVCWIAGNAFQVLANDPPRDDYHDVSVFEKRTITLPSEIEDTQGTWQKFIENSASVALAIRCLTISLERTDGAEQALNRTTNDQVTNHLNECRIRQEAAIRQNARAAADHIEMLVAKRDDVNEAWSQWTAALRGTSTVSSPDATRSAFSRTWTEIVPWVKKSFEYDDSECAQMEHAITDLIGNTTMDKPPKVVLDEAWVDRMQQMSSNLRRTSGDA
jgi:type VI secretion system secreted protein VgrG